MFKNLNYNHLFYFYMTARAGSLTKAAQQLRTSQPSLSIQLKTLERSLDRKLFRKSGRKLVLTESGERVLEHCRGAFLNFENLVEHLRESPGEEGAKIHIGVSEEVERPFVTDAIGLLIKGRAREGAKIRLISQAHDNLVLSLAAREIDMILTNRAVTMPELTKVAEFKLPVGLVAPKSFGKTQLSPISFLRQETVPMAWLTPGHLLWAEVETYLAKHSLRKKIVLETNVLASITRAVADGICAAIVPVPYVYRELSQRRAFFVGRKKLWDHHLFLYAREGAPTKDIESRISSLVKATVGMCD